MWGITQPRDPRTATETGFNSFDEIWEEAPQPHGDGWSQLQIVPTEALSAAAAAAAGAAGAVAGAVAGAAAAAVAAMGAAAGAVVELVVPGIAQ